MKYMVAACVALVMGAAPVQAANCKTTAAEKKLAGAALKSFMTKCENDAKSSCSLSAKEKKLAGAAEASFTNKCVKDRTGG